MLFLPYSAALMLIFASVAFFPLSIGFIIRHKLFSATKRQFSSAAERILQLPLDSNHFCALDKKEQRKCNIQNPPFYCNCPPIPPDGIKKESVSDDPKVCQALLPPVDQPNEQLLTIGVAFPWLEQFMQDPEGFFLEDMEMFTFIPRESILIYRRGCSPDWSAYEFQIGILNSSSMAQLRTISPNIFLSNPFFMAQNPLEIAYVRQTRK